MNKNNAVINNNCRRLQKSYFSLQNFHGYAKEFLRNL